MTGAVDTGEERREDNQHDKEIGNRATEHRHALDKLPLTGLQLDIDDSRRIEAYQHGNHIQKLNGDIQKSLYKSPHLRQRLGTLPVADSPTGCHHRQLKSQQGHQHRQTDKQKSPTHTPNR